jgi:hypothetical protein
MSIGHPVMLACLRRIYQIAGARLALHLGTCPTADTSIVAEH